MSTRQDRFETFAALVEYPDVDYFNRIERAATIGGAPSMDEFAESAKGRGVHELQELWTSTFDLKPVCSLDLGWHLFGENYDRGLMLVRMRAELARHGIAESHELPDHLSHALRLLGRMAPDDAEDFAAACVVPALGRIVSSLPADNLFYPLLLALRELIVAHFPAPGNCALSEPVLQIIREGAMV